MHELRWSYNHRCLYYSVLAYLSLAFRFLGGLGERFASIVRLLLSLSGIFAEDLELLNVYFSCSFGGIRLLLSYKGVLHCFSG